MIMFLLLLLMTLTVICFIACGVFWETYKNLLGSFFFIIGAGLLCFVTYFCGPDIFKTGEPMINIDPGEYKAAFVYPAGDNVSVGIEKANGGSEEKKLYLYQFKRTAFEGGVSRDARKLVVIESGSFKKLKLE